MSPASLRWLGLVGILWLQSINGTNSNFPAYSSQLKNLLSISQLQLNNLAFASDVGKLFGFLSGIASIYLPLWLVLLVGSCLGFIGYGLQYLFIAEGVFHLSYIHIFLLTSLAGNSICWINTVCYIVAINNFPMNRQVAVGLTTSYLGLSAKVYTDIVGALFSSASKRAKAYLFLNSVLPLAVSAITSPIFKRVSSEKISTSRATKIGFVLMFIITIITGIYAVVSSLLSMVDVYNLVGIALFLLVPLVIPLGFRIRETVHKLFCLDKDLLRVHDEESSTGSRRIENEETKEEEDGAFDNGVSDSFGVKEEIGVKKMVKRVDFWLYFFVYLFGATLGLVFLNNLGQIAESRGCLATSSLVSGCCATSSLVSLSSSFGFFGRLLPSLTDYFFSRSKYMIPRPASIAASMAPMAGAFFLLLNKTDLSLYISTAIIGISTGAITSLSVSTTTELFGTTNFGVNHNVLVANIPMGSLVFGNLAAYFYRKEANDANGKCMGTQCYHTTFIVLGSLCSFGTLLAFVLYTRTRTFYLEKSELTG